MRGIFHRLHCVRLRCRGSQKRTTFLLSNFLVLSESLSIAQCRCCSPALSKSLWDGKYPSDAFRPFGAQNLRRCSLKRAVCYQSIWHPNKEITCNLTQTSWHKGSRGEDFRVENHWRSCQAHSTYLTIRRFLLLSFLFLENLWLNNVRLTHAR